MRVFSNMEARSIESKSPLRKTQQFFEEQVKLELAPLSEYEKQSIIANSKSDLRTYRLKESILLATFSLLGCVVVYWIGF